jgi:acetamidase/formamidase
MKPIFAVLAAVVAAHAADYTLKASPSTVAYGYYWSEAKPALRIKSGDTVTVHTLTTSSPTSLTRNGVKPEDVEQELKDIYAQVTGDKKGPGGHILTGPIFVEGAEPGDTLEVRIQKDRVGGTLCLERLQPAARRPCRDRFQDRQD